MCNSNINFCKKIYLYSIYKSRLVCYSGHEGVEELTLLAFV